MSKNVNIYRNSNETLSPLTDFSLKFLIFSIVVLDFVPKVGFCVQLSSFLFGGVYFLHSMNSRGEKMNIINIFSALFMLYCFTVPDYRYDFWRSMGFKSETAMSVTVTTIVSFGLIKCLNTVPKREKAINCIINSTVILAIYFVFLLRGDLLLGLHGEGMHDRLQTYGMNSNYIGVLFSVGFLLSLYRAYCRRYVRDYLYTVILIIFAMLSGSRKVLIYIFVGVIIFNLIKKQALRGAIESMGRIMKTLVLGSLLLIAGYFILTEIPFFYDMLGHRMDSIFELLNTGETTEGSLSARQMMIEEGLNYFYNNPWFGNGLNYFAYFYKSILGRMTYSHNNYIELLVSVGIIGTFLYYIKYAIVILNLIMKRENVQDAIFAAIIIAMAVADIGAVTYYYKFYYIVFGVAAAAVVHRKDNVISIDKEM